MKVDIGKAIRLVLEERHIASLPGLGTFRIEVTPAKLNPAKDLIEPPSSKLVFDEQSINDHSLVEFISEYHEISKVKALKILEVFEQKIKTAISQRKSVRVKGLGSFKLIDGDVIGFKPIKSISESVFYGLKPTSMVLQPVTQIKEETTVVDQPVVEEKQVIAVEESPTIQQTIAAQQLSEVKKTTMPDYNDPNYDKNYGYNSDYDGPSKWSYLLRPLLILLGFLLLSALLFKKCASWSGGKAPVAVVDDFADDTQDDVNEDSNSSSDSNSTDETKENEEDVENETAQFKSSAKVMFKAEDGAEVYRYEDLNNQPLNCIIITGTFGKSTNILRMIKKLEAEGYDSYTEQLPNGLTRVGFFFQCKEENLESYIYDVRQRISDAAWYLSPRIHID